MQSLPREEFGTYFSFLPTILVLPLQWVWKLFGVMPIYEFNRQFFPDEWNFGENFLIDIARGYYQGFIYLKDAIDYYLSGAYLVILALVFIFYLLGRENRHFANASIVLAAATLFCKVPVLYNYCMGLWSVIEIVRMDIELISTLCYFIPYLLCCALFCGYCVYCLIYKIVLRIKRDVPEKR